ncbi:hypothetical protein N658DRAFT_6135 [Parathielavia hyrcaniae]|uniref:Uncharacterized protein n=1 Tax=Parathielavia hyrcaniae TaxID=113614 RepID=A0AAN6Q9I7_9PEZI|nr:hypothetical protein N658DRAFT_6135 [Parathielavia hyrcaniae]
MTRTSSTVEREEIGQAKGVFTRPMTKHCHAVPSTSACTSVVRGLKARQGALRTNRNHGLERKPQSPDPIGRATMTDERLGSEDRRQTRTGATLGGDMSDQPETRAARWSTETPSCPPAIRPLFPCQSGLCHLALALPRRPRRCVHVVVASEPAMG